MLPGDQLRDFEGADPFAVDSVEVEHFFEGPFARRAPGFGRRQTQIELRLFRHFTWPLADGDAGVSESATRADRNRRTRRRKRFLASDDWKFNDGRELHFALGRKIAGGRSDQVGNRDADPAAPRFVEAEAGAVIRSPAGDQNEPASRLKIGAQLIDRPVAAWVLMDAQEKFALSRTFEVTLLLIASDIPKDVETMRIAGEHA